MKKPSYTAVVLDGFSHNLLLKTFPPPLGWEPIAHHMTINMGPAEKGPAAEWLGQMVDLTVKTLAQDNLVMAVGVDCIVPSSNQIKHITVAVNRKDGGKPFFSNKLNNWKPVKTLDLRGTVQEVI